MKTKLCPQCGEEWPLGDFGDHSDRKKKCWHCLERENMEREKAKCKSIRAIGNVDKAEIELMERCIELGETFASDIEWFAACRRERRKQAKKYDVNTRAEKRAYIAEKYWVYA